MIFYTFKNKTRPRALCGIALCSFKNYQCANPPWACGPRKLPIASNWSNRLKAGPALPVVTYPPIRS